MDSRFKIKLGIIARTMSSMSRDGDIKVGLIGTIACVGVRVRDRRCRAPTEVEEVVIVIIIVGGALLDALLDVRGDGVDDTLELLVARLFCVREAPADVSLDVHLVVSACIIHYSRAGTSVAGGGRGCWTGVEGERGRSGGGGGGGGQDEGAGDYVASRGQGAVHPCQYQCQSVSARSPPAAGPTGA